MGLCIAYAYAYAQDPSLLKKMPQMASFWPQICINQFFTTPLAELTTLPQTS